MKKSLLILPLVFIITACGAPSVEDLIEDQELLTKITVECNTLLAQGKDTKTEECINAKKAMMQMTENIMKGIYGK